MTRDRASVPKRYNATYVFCILCRVTWWCRQNGKRPGPLVLRYMRLQLSAPLGIIDN